LKPLQDSALLLLILGFLALPGCELGSGKDKGEDSDDERATPILLVRPTQPRVRDMDRTLEITGEVSALRQATISARISGVRILEVLHHVSDRVKLGTVLVRLEKHDLIQAEKEAGVAKRESEVRVADARLALKELRAQLRAQVRVVAQKNKTLERLKAQEAGGAAAGMDLDAAQDEFDRESGMEERLGIQIEKNQVALDLAKLASEKAQLLHEKAERELGYAEVTAPFDGIISSREANVGQLTAGGQAALYGIFDPSSLVIEVHVPQRDIQDMRPGLRVEIAAEALPGQKLEGTVSVVSAVVEEQTGTIMVRIAPNNPRELKPGIFVSGRIILETRKGTLTVPRKAVAYERERPYVYIIEDVIEDNPGSEEEEPGKRVRRLFFTEGLADGDTVEFLPLDAELKSALRPDHTLVLVGLDRLRDGDPVRTAGAGGAESGDKETEASASTQEGG